VVGIGHLVVKDGDEKYILDVIRRAVKSSGVGINPELVRTGYDCMVRFQLECKRKGDNKLASQYRLLMYYYESRLSAWGLKCSCSR